MASGSAKDQLILTDCEVDPDEAFEFFLDDLIQGWSGIIEIGLALKGPLNRGIRKKYGKNWVLANTDAEATNLKEQAGQTLDRLYIGDAIAVLRQANGNAYFFVNGDQYGKPLEKVPSNVYGMVILHGKGSSKAGVKEDDDRLASPSAQGVPFTLYEEDENKKVTADKQRRTSTGTKPAPCTSSESPTSRPSPGVVSTLDPPGPVPGAGRPPGVVSAPDPPFPAPGAGRPPTAATRRGLSTLTRQLTIPPNWTSEELYTLSETSEEYKKVRAGFKETAQRDIKKIERIQNNGMYQRYMLSLGQLQKNLPPDVPIERNLYHGTQKETISNIIRGSGFNRAYAGKHATKYGNGCYFAVSARYSAKDTYCRPDADGLHYMFRCRVIVGRYCLGTQGMKEPGLIPDKLGERYDSAADNISRPSMFICFRDDHAYPEYLITFS